MVAASIDDNAADGNLGKPNVNLMKVDDIRKGRVKMSWIYRYIASLKTPCGEILVMDQDGQKCRFSLKKNPYHLDCHLFSGTQKEVVINTDTNYLLCIDTNDLKLGHTYEVYLAGSKLHFGDSDEHTEAVSGTFNGYSIAIGAYDPNDDEKVFQAEKYSLKKGFVDIIVPPPQYDESRFRAYNVEMLRDYSGFRFRLLDYAIQEIKFPVAWIKNDYEGQSEYEAAVELWTT